MATQNIPDMKCPCPGTLTVQPSLNAKGVSTVSDTDAWNNLQNDMPGGLAIMAFYLAVAAAAPTDCGGDCGKPSVTQTNGPTGYAGSATKDKDTGVTTWEYTWTFTLNVTVVCDHPKKALTLHRPELIVVEKKKEP